MTDQQDLANEFLNPEQSEEEKQDGLDRLSIMIDIRNDAAEDVNKLAEDLAAAQKKLRGMDENDLPTLMNELGFKIVTLEDGRTILIEKGLSASIAKKNKAEAAKWLVDNELSEIVSYDITINFSPEKKEQFETVRKELEDRDLYPDSAFNMHTGRVKAALKELDAQGVEFPEKLFGVYRWEQAKVKPAKK